MNSVLELAMRYYDDFELNLIPLKPRTKEAAVSWKKWQQERASRLLTEKWFRRENVGIAVICGEVSGGWRSRDFDVPESYQAWAEQHPGLAESLTTEQTGGGGFQVFCYADESDVLDLSPNGAGVIPLGDGELRVHSCYSVLPETEHESGVRYTWMNGPETHPPQYVGDLHAAGLTQGFTHAMSNACVNGADAGGSGVAAAVAATLPTRAGQRNHAVFRLVQHLKALSPDSNASEWKTTLVDWHARALPVIRTKDLAETWRDFEVAWSRARCRAGGAIDPIVARARELKSVGRQYRDKPLLAELERICLALQQHHGRRPFFLSCRIAGRLLGVSHVKANDMMRQLVSDRVLDRVSVGTKASRRASEYLYRGHIDDGASVQDDNLSV